MGGGRNSGSEVREPFNEQTEKLTPSVFFFFKTVI